MGEFPPPAPRACFGRGELIEKVIKIAENFEPIALIGAEGIGKTSIALTVLHHDRIKKRFGENRRFIHCGQFPASRSHFLARLSKVIGAGVENPEDMAPLRPLLSSKEMLIVLDNAESILDPQGTNYKEVYAVADELCQFKTICVCITSRFTTVPRYCKRPRIPTLSMEAARDIFYGVYGDDEQSGIIDVLLQRLDFHALSITLLATTASDNMWDHDRLAKEWDVNRTQLLRTEHNESLGATIEATLASPTFRELGPNARELLGVIAFFPQGINEKNLDWLFPTIPDRNNIFGKFCALSLTYRSNSFITMSAPVRAHLYPRDPESCLLLCATKDYYLAWLGHGEAWRIKLEDANIEHLLNVFTSIDLETTSHGRKSSVVSVGPQLLMFLAVPTSSNTGLNTDVLGSSPTSSVLRPQSHDPTTEVPEPGPQDPSVGIPQTTGPEPQTLVDGYKALIPEWKRLISCPLTTNERISLITAIFSDGIGTETVKHLRGDDAQTFVDVIDEVLPALSPRKSRLSDLKLNFPFCQIDVGCTATVAPEEVSGCFAQDMRSFRLGPKVHRNPTTVLRPVG